jgi:hypothetical protein
MVVSPDVFSDMLAKQVDLYDPLCSANPSMAYESWLRFKFGISPLTPTEFAVTVDYRKPPNYWNFLEAPCD